MDVLKSSLQALLVKARDHPVLTTAAVAAVSAATVCVVFARNQQESHSEHSAVAAVIKALRPPARLTTEECRSAVDSLVVSTSADPVIRECCAEDLPGNAIRSGLVRSIENMVSTSTFVRRGASVAVFVPQGQPLCSLDVSRHASTVALSALSGWTRYGRFSLVSEAMVPRRLRVTSPVASSTGYIYLQWFSGPQVAAGTPHGDGSSGPAVGTASGAGATPQDARRDEALIEVLKHADAQGVTCFAEVTDVQRDLQVYITLGFQVVDESTIFGVPVSILKRDPPASRA